MPHISHFFLSLSRYRVRAGVPAAVLVLFFSRPNALSLGTGLAVCVLGLGLRGWAAGHLRKDSRLTTTGPYRFSRNPLYLANFILGIGLLIAANSLACWAVFFAYFLLFYPATIQLERKKMAMLFPEQYQEYGRRVPLFFPNLRHLGNPDSQKFQLNLYLKNKEYRALAAVLGFWLLLFFRFLWLKS